MKVKQIFEIVNTMANDILGKPNYLGSDGNVYPNNKPRTTPDGVEITYGDPSWNLAEDLTNIVDVGNLMFENIEGKFDNFVGKLIDHIGRVVFVDRKYSPVVPSIMKNNWEFGSIVEKIDADMPDSEMNPKWALENGKTYNQDEFITPKGVRVKFFNDAITYQIRMSYTEDQLKEAFSNATQLGAFFGMIETKIKNRTSVDYANLTRATINSFIAGTVYNDAHGLLQSDGSYNFGNNSFVKTINLLGLYKEEGKGLDLTPETALKDTDFLKFASYHIMLISDRLADISTLYNVGGRERFTPKDMQHIVMLSEFEKAANVYLQSSTFHNELTRLPKAETINYWQGTGDDYRFSSTSTIRVKSKVTTDGSTFESKETTISGVICAIFDTEALGVNNEKNKTTSHYNANGDFINNFYKSFARYFNDFDENGVVFIVQ